MAISGYEVVANQVTSSSGEFNATVTCPTGKIAVGGGAWCPDARGRLISNGPLVVGGTPVTANGWGATVHNEDVGAGQLTLNVYVICADA